MSRYFGDALTGMASSLIEAYEPAALIRKMLVLPEEVVQHADDEQRESRRGLLLFKLATVPALFCGGLTLPVSPGKSENVSNRGCRPSE